VSFYCRRPGPNLPFPACLSQRKLLIPARRTMLGRKLLNWFNEQSLPVEIMGEFDDAALMTAFGMGHDAIFVAPSLHAREMAAQGEMMELGRLDNIQDEYYVIFAERMIQHPAVQRVCNEDFSLLFRE